MKRKDGKEKPTQTGFRLFKLHRDLLKKAVKEKGISAAQIVREAIEAYLK